jgi:hypothetical protein
MTKILNSKKKTDNNITIVMEINKDEYAFIKDQCGYLIDR